jgi:hypothetical protein
MLRPPAVAPWVEEADVATLVCLLEVANPGWEARPGASVNQALRAVRQRFRDQRKAALTAVSTQLLSVPRERRQAVAEEVGRQRTLGPLADYQGTDDDVASLLQHLPLSMDRCLDAAVGQLVLVRGLAPTGAALCAAFAGWSPDTPVDGQRTAKRAARRFTALAELGTDHGALRRRFAAKVLEVRPATSRAVLEETFREAQGALFTSTRPRVCDVTITLLRMAAQRAWDATRDGSWDATRDGSLELTLDWLRGSSV